MNLLSNDPPRSSKLVALVICTALLLLFAVLSYSAARTKSATFDEPLHLLGGYVHRSADDFRLNPEDPALFGFVAALPLGPGAIQVNYQSPLWLRMLADFNDNQWKFVMTTLFQDPRNDGDALIQRSRLIFLVLGLLLGAIIARWTWALAGPLAAIAATALFALDPNFMAHSSLVKNDVFLTMLICALAMAVWRFGQRGTILRLAAIALLCGAAVNVKFSGVLCGPLVFAMLLARALLPEPWMVLKLNLQNRWQRLAAVAATCAVVAIISYFAIWACYGFRYGPTPNPQALLNTPKAIEYVKVSKLQTHKQIGDEYTGKEVELEPVGILVELLSFAERNHLLPQAWTHGFIHTYATTFNRLAYLMGEISHVGWWYYFPCVFAFKTPTATLCAIAIAAIIGFVFLIWRRTGIPRWSIICLAVPLGIYGASAITTRMNIGLRHILPMYPFLFIAAGCLITEMIQRRRKLGGIIAGLLALGLAVESFAAYPNFIAFFNVPSGGPAGGISLLSDSNLDWGQDLKLLSQWQKDHPDKKLYLSYFGLADPAFYGVTAVHIPGGWGFTTSWGMPPRNESCYLAVSASNIQGVFVPLQARKTYQSFLDFNPIAVLGGSIYIYELPFAAEARKSPPQ